MQLAYQIVKAPRKMIVVTISFFVGRDGEDVRALVLSIDLRGELKSRTRPRKPSAERRTLRKMTP